MFSRSGSPCTSWSWSANRSPRNSCSVSPRPCRSTPQAPSSTAILLRSSDSSRARVSMPITLAVALTTAHEARVATLDRGSCTTRGRGRLRRMSQSFPDLWRRESARRPAPRQPEQAPRRTKRQSAIALGGVPLFADFSKKHLQRLAADTDELTFAPGAAVVREGELGETLFVVLEGEAKVVRGSKTGGLRAARRLLRRAVRDRRTAAQRLGRGRDARCGCCGCSDGTCWRC